jgi:DNA-binding beta-propeller fold protein YncE
MLLGARGKMHIFRRLCLYPEKEEKAMLRARHRLIWQFSVLVTAAVVLCGDAAGQAASPSLPSLAFAPSEEGFYDFGPVKVGQTASQEFTLTNSGGSSTSSLTFMLSGEGAAAFAITEDECTIEALGPGMSCMFTVEYSPTGTGVIDTATLTVTGQKEAASASLELSGTGKPRYIYWANNTMQSIGRADLDEDGNVVMDSVNQGFIMTMTDPRGVAVDAGHVYWTNARAGTVGRADLDEDGNVVMGSVNQEFITDLVLPTGLAVDAEHIYWTDTRAGTVGCADLDEDGNVVMGSVNQELIISGNIPHGVAVDTGHLYWANGGNNTIGRADLEGKDVVQDFISTSNNPRGVAVDPE